MTGAHRAVSQRDDQERQALRLHAAVFATSMLVIVLVNASLNAAAGLLGEWWAWWSALALVGWGLGLTIHGLVVHLARHRASTPCPGWGSNPHSPKGRGV
jgi:hypothetical protein